MSYHGMNVDVNDSIISALLGELIDPVCSINRKRLNITIVTIRSDKEQSAVCLAGIRHLK